MRKILLVLALLALVVPAVAAQSNHPPVYIIGGYQTTSTYTYYPQGLFKYDGTGAVPTLMQFAPTPGYRINYNTVIMDWNNKDLLAATAGTSSTLYTNDGAILKWDAGTNAWSVLATFYKRPGTYATGYAYGYVYENMITDQNGDVLFSTYEYDRVTSPTTVYKYNRCIMKLDRATSVISTVLTTMQVPAMDSDYFGNILTDIDTGKLLITNGQYETTPTTIKYPVLSLNPENGYNPTNLAYWNDGSVYGWNRYSYTTRQNHRTGNIETPYYYVSSTGTGYINAIKPGSGSVTTLASWPASQYPGTSYFYGYSGKYDLQTAAKPLYRQNGYYSSQGDWLVNYDVLNGWTIQSHTTLMSSVICPQYNYYYGQYNFEFYGGRHLQTIRTGANKWDVRISVPHHPGKNYIVALSAAGVRPGIALPDGRNINMNYDPLMFMSVNNYLAPYFKPGPGTLDKNGEAVATIDVSSLPIPKGGLGQPIWIAVLVLDPKAPAGMAYLPDTHVIRI